MKSDLQTEVINDLMRRKKISREYLRSLSPEEKTSRLVDLQEQYYQMLVVREENDGLPIPERWRKWHQARYEKLS
jgi:hypothetical protein